VSLSLRSSSLGLDATELFLLSPHELELSRTDGLLVDGIGIDGTRLRWRSVHYGRRSSWLLLLLLWRRRSPRSLLGLEATEGLLLLAHELGLSLLELALLRSAGGSRSSRSSSTGIDEFRMAFAMVKERLREHSPQHLVVLVIIFHAAEPLGGRRRGGGTQAARSTLGGAVPDLGPCVLFPQNGWLRWTRVRRGCGSDCDRTNPLAFPSDAFVGCVSEWALCNNLYLVRG